MGVFPYLVWHTAPLLWLCFSPSPDSSGRFELHVQVQGKEGLPRTQLFRHTGPGWDTLYLPPSPFYRLQVKVLEGRWLREMWRLDTTLAGMLTPEDLPDPLPWSGGEPACPPSTATGIRVAGPPGSPLTAVFTSPWGDTFSIQKLTLPDEDTFLPLPDRAVFHVMVRGPGKRVGHGAFRLRSPHLLDFLSRQEGEAVVRLFGGEGALKRFQNLSPEARPPFLDSLLAPFDPDPATPRNEFMDTLQVRVRFAREHFQEGLRRGLETDRGRVFVRYGPPREVEERVEGLTQQVYLIWHYPDQGVQAVFLKVDWTTYILLEIRPE